MQNLELGKDVITEIARYATAFGAGLLPVHTYYTGSKSWLVPVIEARLTDAAAVAPCRPACIGSVRERVLTGAIVTANTDNLQEV